MGANLNLTLGVTGDGKLTGSNPIGVAVDRFAAAGGLNFPSLALALGYGTGNQQAQTWFQAVNAALAAGATDQYDLRAGSVVNNLGQPVQLNAVKLLLLAVLNPDGVKSLRVGPQGLAAGWQGPFGVATAGAYLTVTDWLVLPSSWGGYPVNGGSKILGINNPGANPVGYALFVVGL